MDHIQSCLLVEVTMNSTESMFIDGGKVYNSYADHVKCLELINLITELLLAFTQGTHWMNGRTPL